MPQPAHAPAVPAFECVTFACDFAAGRAAARRIRDFLARQGIGASELFGFELVLAEACNNAVQHVGDRGRHLPITASAVCTDARIEFRIVDHTDGFDWPKGRTPLPPPDAEHGRGLFIIQSTMDGATYERGQGENTLTMWKARSGAKIDSQGRI